MNTNIFFSIIIPTYNRDYCIEKTIASALNQTYNNYEIIIYDDGSTDNTRNVLEKYKSKINYYHSENEGLVNTRKKAIELSTGNWIALLDSDDIWKSSYLENLVNIIQQFPERDFIISNFSNLDENGNEYFDQFNTMSDEWWSAISESKHKNLALLKDDCYLAFLEFQPVFPSAASFSRTLYNKIGGMDSRVGKKLAEDAHFSRRMAAYGRVACNFEKNVYIVKQADNMSSNIAINNLNRMEILEMLIENKQIPEKYVKATRSTINSWQEPVLSSLFQYNYYDQFVKLFLRLDTRSFFLKTYIKFFIAYIYHFILRK